MQVAITALQQLVAVLIFVVIVVVAVFKIAGMVRAVLTALLSALLLAHYLVLFSLSSRIEVYLLPFVVVESSYVASTSRVESVFYPDVGQLSALALIILWRREVKHLVNRGLRRVRSDSSRAGQAG